MITEFEIKKEIARRKRRMLKLRLMMKKCNELPKDTTILCVCGRYDRELVTLGNEVRLMQKLILEYGGDL